MSVDAVRANLRRAGVLAGVERVAEKHGVTLEDIAGKSRIRHIVAARHEAWALVRWTLGWSYPAVAIMFGGVDHTTVIIAVRGYARKVGVDAA